MDLTAAVATVHIERKDIARKNDVRRSWAIVLLVAVIAVDQAVKWWAWRHIDTARINFGGDIFVNATISRWYANPVSGAVLDLLGFGFLLAATAFLVHRRHPVVLVMGAFTIGGWASNLVDRLGLHYWTAPGSVRGAVDFIQFGNIYFNVADVFIMVGTLPLAVALYATSRSASTVSAARRRYRPRRARGWLSGGAIVTCLVAVVTVGAANYGGITVPGTVTSEAAGR
ncbi:MAG: signal peptidase [Actinomycetota bacterium]|nr:signal peptidase [Actinomycetota bacterium]